MHHLFGLNVDRFENRVEAAILNLAESQRHTDERLNALIAIVDGLQRQRGGQ